MGDYKVSRYLKGLATPPTGGIGRRLFLHFNVIYKIYCVVLMPMYRQYLVGCTLHNHPRTNGWVPPIVNFHFRLLGISLF